MIKCGIIGCGVIAPTHIEGYRSLPEVEVIHLCDLIPERVNALGDKYGIARRSVDCKELLADPEVDAVSVCTDHASHAQIVCDALAAGKHVICEKALGRVPGGPRPHDEGRRGTPGAHRRRHLPAPLRTGQPPVEKTHRGRKIRQGACGEPRLQLPAHERIL